jgi:hypothetical protein
MYVPCLCTEYIKGLVAIINFTKKDMLDNVRGNICCPYKHCKNDKKYHIDDVLKSNLIQDGFMEDYRCWNKYGEERLNQTEMRDSYLKREILTGVEEVHDDVNVERKDFVVRDATSRLSILHVDTSQLCLSHVVAIYHPFYVYNFHIDLS